MAKKAGVFHQCVTKKKKKTPFFTHKSLCGSFSKFQWNYLDTKSSQVIYAHKFLKDAIFMD